MFVGTGSDQTNSTIPGITVVPMIKTALFVHHFVVTVVLKPAQTLEA